MPNDADITRSRSGSARGKTPVLALLLILSACDGLFDVENPTNLLDEDLTDPQLENTLSSTAEGNLVGPISWAMRYGTLLTDQYWHPSLTHWGTSIDLGYREREISVVEDMYVDLAAGRWIADDMVMRLQAMVADPEAHLGIARSYFWGGEARMQLAAYFREVHLDPEAEPVTPAAAIADAIERFKRAGEVAGAAGDRNLEAGAYGATARAYRSLYYEPIALGEGPGDPAHVEAAERWALMALHTSADYRVEARFGSPGPPNWMGTRERERMTPWYAYAVDPVTGELDPRITHEPPDTSPAGEVLLRDLKFPDDQVPLPISRAAEAELIIAEVRHIAADMQGAVEFINRVRARSALPPFDSTDPDAIWQQLLYERDIEMWLEGRRWEDMRYYNIIPECPGAYTSPTVEGCGGAFLWDDANKREGMAKRWKPAPPGAGSGQAPTTG